MVSLGPQRGRLVTLTASVGVSRYAVNFDLGTLLDLSDDAARTTANGLAAELQPYLVSTLHRWSGEMAEMSYAYVEPIQDGYIVHAGSGSDHTIWHELRYHPQLRETLDRFGPLLAARIRSYL